MERNAYASRNTILRQMGYASYAEYLQSDLWASIKERVLVLLGDRCGLCEKPSRVIHHKGYGASVLKGDTIHQLIPLCNKCHARIEFDLGGRKRSMLDVHGAFSRLRATRNGRVKRLPPEERKCHSGWCEVCGQRAKKGRRRCRRHEEKPRSG